MCRIRHDFSDRGFRAAAVSRLKQVSRFAGNNDFRCAVERICNDRFSRGERLHGRAGETFTQGEVHQRGRERQILPDLVRRNEACE